MKKKNLPETSHAANRKATAEMRDAHKAKIVKALQSLGTGTYEEIASFLCMEPHSIGRRLCELERVGIIFKPGTTRVTKSGRDACLYTLQQAGKIIEKTTVKSPTGPSVSDFSKKLIKQPTLF